jgi:hypothetical protein
VSYDATNTTLSDSIVAFIPAIIGSLVVLVIAWRAFRRERIGWLGASILTATSVLVVATGALTYRVFSSFGETQTSPLTGIGQTVILSSFLWVAALIPGTILGSLSGLIWRAFLRKPIRFVGCKRTETERESVLPNHFANPTAYLIAVGCTSLTLALMIVWSGNSVHRKWGTPEEFFNGKCDSTTGVDFYGPQSK